MLAATQRNTIVRAVALTLEIIHKAEKSLRKLALESADPLFETYHVFVSTASTLMRRESR
jgi:hypothetical protein